MPPKLGAVRLLAIDGPSGSGKSVLADRVVADFRQAGIRTALVRTDHFATWEDPVAWWPRLVDGVLEPLRGNQPGRYQRVEWVAGSPRPGPSCTVEGFRRSGPRGRGCVVRPALGAAAAVGAGLV